MAILGIEGTAHTLGVGIVEEASPGRARILANERAMVRPLEGGIHPRDAAHHHAEIGPSLVHAALAKAGLQAHELDGIAFSQGPGLGPCLRVAATMARALALRTGKPLVGVNHCVAHLEIGRALSDAADPMLLYASGGNTQVLAFARGRYRVFGETLDVGLGNALDKFGRDNGIPFPGGPEVERLAAQSRDVLHPLPYIVKGMDLSFAGLATAAQRLVTAGTPLPEVCRSIQEHAFAALVEVSERALAHTGKPELLLGGGVACNSRLQAMARAMCEDRGVRFLCPPREVLVDNGAMIAWLGLRSLASGGGTPLAASQPMPHQRTDQVEVTWRGNPAHTSPKGPQAANGSSPRPVRSVAALTRRGAEALVEPATHLGRPLLAKRRLPKAYRDARLDARLRDERTRDEANLLAAARAAGVPVPVVLDAAREAATLLLQEVPGTSLREALAADDDPTAAARLQALGRHVAALHDAGVAHGDLTTSNVLVPAGAAPASLVLIDFGLGAFSDEAEERGVDLHLLEEALQATDARATGLFAAFLDGYGASARAAATLRRLEDIRERGRYR